jgi:hypothetical protein
MSADPVPDESRPRRNRRRRPGDEGEAPRADDASFGPAEAPFATRCNLLLVSFLSLFVIGFGVWLVSGGKRYREEYAQATEGWRVGSTRVVELTLVKEDKTRLACASDQEIAGLRCGYRGNQREPGPLPPDSPQILQPYNTVANELLLGAGLWSAPDLKKQLPPGRFTVICNYNIKGVLKSAAIRFDPTASFSALGKTVTLGTLSDCMAPR